MRKPEPRFLILAGICFAGILLLTCLVRVPLEILRDGKNAGAYFNMGDLGVYLAAAFLGGPWGALCAGLAEYDRGFDRRQRGLRFAVAGHQGGHGVRRRGLD